MMREVTRVHNKRHEVEYEGNEQLFQDGAEVSLPHEVNKDTNLSSGKDLVIVSF